MKSEALSDAKRRLLELLKRLGRTTVGDLARALGLTDVAVRQHLQALEEHGLVEQHPLPPKGRGRPAVEWGLTALSGELFPDRHAELTVELIESVREAFGPDALDRLIKTRSRRQIAAYTALAPHDLPLAERLTRLAEQRSAEGYMAEAIPEPDGSFLLVEHHCPICEAARTCTGLCRGELEVFRRALGDGARVEREQHLLSDADRCAYRVTPVAAEVKSSRPLKNKRSEREGS